MPGTKRQSKKTDTYFDEYESEEEDETPTLMAKSMSRSKPSAYRKMVKKSTRRPGSQMRGKTQNPTRTTRDMWINAVKSRGALNGNRRSESPRHKTPIEFWSDTLRKTRTGISTESTGPSTFTGLRQMGDKDMAYLSSSSYLKQVFGIGNSKKGGDPTVRAAPGTPAYKTPEEYYDDILELKKQVASVNQDNGMLKAKLRRVEEDNLKKEKEIDGFLNPGKSDELRRTLGDRKPESAAVIHSLKQKIMKVEVQSRDKEASLVKLQTDLKTTKIDEMKIQLEEFYKEIVRLQNSRDTGGEKSSRPSHESNVKVKALNESVLRLSDTNKQLQIENKKLREDLNKAMDGHDGPIKYNKRDFEALGRKELIALITRLERKLERSEKRTDYDATSLTSFDSRRSEMPGKIELKGNLQERLDQLDKRETDLLNEITKQKETIKRLQSDRNHYRQKSEGHAKDMKVLQRDINMDRIDSVSARSGSRRKSPSPGGSPRKSPRALSESGRSGMSSSRRSKVRNEDEQMQNRRISDFMNNDGKRRGVKYESDPEVRNQRVEDFMRNHAAKQIQRKYREYDYDNAAIKIQSALHGHKARRYQIKNLQYGESNDDRETLDGGMDDDMSMAANMLQSNLRGHKARREMIRGTRLDSTDDEGSLISGPSRGSSLKGRPMSAKSRASNAGSSFRRSPVPSQASRSNIFNRRSPTFMEEDDDDDDIMS